MTRVVIVGEIYNADLSIGGGPVYPGGPGAPVDPGYGRPGWSPVDPGWGQGHPIGGHPGNRPPGSWDGTHPANRPPGSWGGPVDPGWGGGGFPHPGGGPMPGGERPDNTLPEVLPQGGTEVPPDVMPPPPVPEEIASQYIVSVYNPKTMTWTTKSYSPR